MNTVDRQRRLEAAILAYLEAEDGGDPRAARLLLGAHPDLADELELFLADQRRLAELLAPWRASAGNAGAGTPPPSPAEDSTCDAEPPPSLPPGYAYFGPLGDGGMGRVYKVRQVALDKIVALKVIRHRRLRDGDAVSRFQNEARTLAKLDHPHIVRVHDGGEVGGTPYLVMEYVAGGTLKERLAGGPLLPRTAVELLLPVADAISYAHGLNIIHRDLKPANVLLTPGGVPKVADFGLSKQLNEPGGRTRAGLGTPAYMPPEQAEGHLDAMGPATDVFGLGAILYHMLTGRPPYTGSSAAEVVRLAAGRACRPPRAIRPGIPARLEAICLKAMAADPARRHPSAAALAADLRAFLRTYGRARRLALACAALLGVACACGAAAAWYHRPPDTRAGQSAQADRPAPEPVPPAPQPGAPIVRGPNDTIAAVRPEELMALPVKVLPERPEPPRLAPDVFTNSVGMKLRKLLTDGKDSFWMGSRPDEPGRELQEVQHLVTLTRPFAIGVYEVTEAEYRQVMGGDGGDGSLPQGASWEDARRFCARLSERPGEKLAGRSYRLPTEAEWEYACRAGTTTAYSYGDDPAELAGHAWFAGNGDGALQMVGGRKPNPWGLYDMHGNVAEWCEDTYRVGSYPRAAVTDPPPYAGEGSSRVLRGGSFEEDAEQCRSAQRGNSLYHYCPKNRSVGFRVVCVTESGEP